MIVYVEARDEKHAEELVQCGRGRPTTAMVLYGHEWNLYKVAIVAEKVEGEDAEVL